MARILVIVVAIVAVLGGGLFFLSSRAHETKQTRTEKAVSLGNLQG